MEQVSREVTNLPVNSTDICIWIRVSNVDFKISNIPEKVVCVYVPNDTSVDAYTVQKNRTGFRKKTDHSSSSLIYTSLAIIEPPVKLVAPRSVGRVKGYRC